MNRDVPRSRRFVAALLAALLAGCQTWQPATVSPGALISEEAPSSVRITRMDGEIVTIKGPIIRNDSILSAEEGLGGVVGVPTQDIRSLEVRRLDTRKTLLFVAAAVGITVVWTRAATGSSGGTDINDGPLPKDPATGVRPPVP